MWQYTGLDVGIYQHNTVCTLYCCLSVWHRSNRFHYCKFWRSTGRSPTGRIDRLPVGSGHENLDRFHHCIASSCVTAAARAWAELASLAARLIRRRPERRNKAVLGFCEITSWHDVGSLVTSDQSAGNSTYSVNRLRLTLHRTHRIVLKKPKNGSPSSAGNWYTNIHL